MRYLLLLFLTSPLMALDSATLTNTAKAERFEPSILSRAISGSALTAQEETRQSLEDAKMWDMVPQFATYYYQRAEAWNAEGEAYLNNTRAVGAAYTLDGLKGAEAFFKAAIAEADKDKVKVEEAAAIKAIAEENLATVENEIKKLGG